jgi:hypothetical protein
VKKILLGTAGVMLVGFLALLAIGASNPYHPTIKDDASFACFWSARRSLLALGTPADAIHEQYSDESVFPVRDRPGVWQCHVVIQAPNIYGATRVWQWTVQVKNLRHADDGTLFWDVDSLTPI